MDNTIHDVDAQIEAILDITDNNLYEAVLLVCNDIQTKQANQSNTQFFQADILADGMAEMSDWSLRIQASHLSIHI